MEQEISTKNTKAQILEAYEKLLAQVKSSKNEVPKQAQEEKLRFATVEKVAKVSETGITSEIGALKNRVGSSLDELGQKLTNEFKKLEEIREAISIEKKSLEDLYSLTATTDSLAAMILAQKEQKEQFETEWKAKKEAFEQEMAELRTLWKLEKEKQLSEEKEYNAELKKKRVREEEEYQYKLKIERQKEKDNYEAQKLKLEKELAEKQAAFEKEFEERKTKIEEAETELVELRKKNEAFPEELSKAVEQTYKTTTEKLNLQHKFETELKEKEVDGELKLKAQTITALNQKIKEMEITIKELSQKTATAELSVKDIAMKAIESSAKPYYMEKTKGTAAAE
jgi:hypothetical protein